MTAEYIALSILGALLFMSLVPAVFAITMVRLCEWLERKP